MQTLKPADRQALRNWDNFIENFIKTVAADKNESLKAQKERIEKLESNFEDWKQYYFPTYCYAPPAKFHKDASRRALKNPEYYEVRAWARELAKDAVEMFETIYQVLTKKKKNIILVSNSYDKAEELLTPYRLNLELNERIINDYGVQKMPGSWQKGDFITTGGASFLAIGAGQSPRGSRNEEVRPDKIIISDIDTDEDCRNSETIKKRWEWFERALFPTRSVSKDFQVVWLGNIIAKDCCIKRAIKKADYWRIINLEDKNGKSTWPEKNSQENIARIKSKISTAAYQQEYLNNPLSEGRIFKKMQWGKVPRISSFASLQVYGDPSPTNKENGKNSPKAVFLIGEKNGIFYVLHGFCQQTQNAKFVNWFFDLRDRVNARSQLNFAIENNSLQDPFFEQVLHPLFIETGKKRGHIAIHRDNRKKPDKVSRIEGNLEPLHNNGQLILNEAEKENPHFQTLEEHFLLVDPSQPKATIDGADCIEGGVFEINRRKTNNVDAIKITPRQHAKKF